MSTQTENHQPDTKQIQPYPNQTSGEQRLGESELEDIVELTDEDLEELVD